MKLNRVYLIQIVSMIHPQCCNL